MHFIYGLVLLLEVVVFAQETPQQQITALEDGLPSCSIACIKTGYDAANCYSVVCGCGTAYDTISSIVTPCVETACEEAVWATVGKISEEICSVVSANPGATYSTATGASTAVSTSAAFVISTSPGGQGTTALVGTTLSTSVAPQAVATETSSSTTPSSGGNSGSDTGSGSSSDSGSSSNLKNLKKTRLSGGAKAGIGVGSTLGAVLLAAIIRLAFWWGRSGKKETPTAPATENAPIVQYPYGKAEMGPGNPVTAPPPTMKEKENANVGVGILDLNPAPLTTVEKQELDRRRRAAELEGGEAAMLSPETEGGERAELEARRKAAGVVHEMG